MFKSKEMADPKPQENTFLRGLVGLERGTDKSVEISQAYLKVKIGELSEIVPKYHKKWQYLTRISFDPEHQILVGIPSAMRIFNALMKLRASCNRDRDISKSILQR